MTTRRKKAGHATPTVIRCSRCGFECMHGTKWPNNQGVYTLGSTHVCNGFAYGTFRRSPNEKPDPERSDGL